MNPLVFQKVLIALAALILFTVQRSELSLGHTTAASAGLSELVIALLPNTLNQQELPSSLRPMSVDAPGHQRHQIPQELGLEIVGSC